MCKYNYQSAWPKQNYNALKWVQEMMPKKWYHNHIHIHEYVKKTCNSLTFNLREQQKSQQDTTWKKKRQREEKICSVWKYGVKSQC